MKEFIRRVRENKFTNALKSLLSSKFFPLCFIPVSLACYYLGLDMAMIYIIGITGTLTLLFFDDVTPMVTLLLFTALLVSEKNTPSPLVEGTSDFYFRTVNLVQIFVLICSVACAAIYRAVKNIINKKFTLTPVFYGFCAFAAVLLLNGVFSAGYEAKNLVFGLMLALCFLGIFIILKDNLNTKSDGFIKIAYAFFAFGVVLTIELLVKYLTADNIIHNGEVKRELLAFGWGMYNTLGVYMAVCIPFAVYLAGKEKWGIIFAATSVVVFFAAIMSCSRQNIIGAVIVYPVSLAVLFIRGKNKLKNAATIVTTSCIVLIGILARNDKIFIYFAELFKKIVENGELDGNGRMPIWKTALGYFKSAPVLGKGFYLEFTTVPDFAGLRLIPPMAHCTIMQLLCSCGILGLIVYAAHRATTIISYLKNITVERTYVAFAIGIFLIISIVDNHVFNIFSTIIYSVLIATLESGEKSNDAIADAPKARSITLN